MVVAYGNIGNKLNVNNERDKMKNINKHFLKVQLIRVASIVSVFMIITYQFSAMNIFAVTNQLCDDDGEFRYTKKKSDHRHHEARECAKLGQINV